MQKVRSEIVERVLITPLSILLRRISLLEVLCKKDVLINFAKFTGKHLFQSLFFNKKETLTQVFSFEFCEIFKNTLFKEIPATAASVYTQQVESLLLYMFKIGETWKLFPGKAFLMIYLSSLIRLLIRHQKKFKYVESQVSKTSIVNFD